MASSEHGLARGVIAGGPLNADPRQIDRRGLGHLGEPVRHPHEIVGVDVLGIGWVRPGPGFRVELAEIVALDKDDRTRALAASGGEIVANAEIVPGHAEPHRLLDRGALRARDRDAVQHVLLLDDVGAGAGCDHQSAGQRNRRPGAAHAGRPADFLGNGHGGLSGATNHPSWSVQAAGWFKPRSGRGLGTAGPTNSTRNPMQIDELGSAIG